MKKNDIVKGTCVSYTYQGFGVVKVDGFPLFVKNLILGEEAEIIVTMVKKQFGYGRVKQLLTRSEDRVEPLCPLAGKCGGCQIQHMSRKHQAFFKKEQVESVMRRIAHIDTEVSDVLMMENGWNYRNKAQVPFQLQNDRVVCGFYRLHSNESVDMNECMIQHPVMNRVLQIVKGYLSQKHSVGSLRHLLIKYARSSDEIMVVFITSDANGMDWEPLVQLLCEKVPQIKSVMLNINQRGDNVILGEEEILLYGQPYISDRIFDLSFRIAMKSFYQVNPQQTEVLYRTVMQYAQLSGSETVLDCYCGVGTIGLCLAKQAKQVIGIEIIPEAIENAKENAKRNHIENAQFICADAKAYAKELSDHKQKIDVVIVDPPRKGCDEQVLESIASMAPQRIVYVSCDVATQARDIERLKRYGYHAAAVQPVDMFPQTQHVETIVCLSHKSPESVINVKVDFGEGEGKVPLDTIAERAKKYQPKPKITYKMIQEYVKKKYGFKVHTAYIAEVKRSLGLTMYGASNAVEELKHPRKRPPKEKIEAITDALRYFEVI